MKLLVTGCAGFIGYHLSKKLLEQGHHVLGIDNINNYYDVKLKNDRLKLLKKQSKRKLNFKFIKLDIAKKNLISKICKKYKIKKIIHLAAQAGVRFSIINPQAYIDANVTGFLNILEACKTNKINHLIYASTSSVYGANTNFPLKEIDPADHPIQLYAVTKRSNELMAHAYSHLYNIPTTGLRFFTVYGPWGRPDMALYKFTKNIIQKKPIEVFNYGKHIRDFTYIDDIIDAILKIFSKGFKKEKKWKFKKPDVSSSYAPFNVINIGNGKPINLNKYIKLIEKELKTKSKKKFLKLQPGDIIKTHASIQKLKKTYKFKSNFTVAQGIKNYIKWFKNYYKY